MTDKQIPNPFDPASLRLSQDFSNTAGVKKLLTTVPVRKPNKQHFIRVHPDPAYRLVPAAVIEVKDDREIYLIDPKLALDLQGEYVEVAIYLAIDRQGVVFLWPVKLPDAGGRRNTWNDSALEAAERAQKAWLRVSANMSLGAYQLTEATIDIPEPNWPDLAFSEILQIAFKNLLVDSLEHPLVKRLRGFN